MKTKDFKHIYECVKEAIAGEFGDDEERLRDAASVIFTRLLTGDGEEKEDIIYEYGLECCRACEQCGELMTEGWQLDATVVCSDECAAKFFDENFIRQAMERDHSTKKYEDLTEEERAGYLDDAFRATDFYWTEWE